MTILICFSFLWSNDPKESSAERVIVEVSQGILICGNVVEQTDTTITVRTVKGELRTLQTDDVSQIIKLVEVGKETTGAVYLKDGRIFRGVIESDGFEEVVLIRRGVIFRFARNLVNRVVIDRPFEEVYAELLERLDISNDRQLTYLVEWLLSKNQPALAKTHLDNSQSTNSTIELLRVTTSSRLRANETQPSITKHLTKGELFEQTFPGKLLSDEEVNLIRVYEIDLNDPPRIIISHDTRQRLVDLYSADPRVPLNARKAISKMSDYEVFTLMRELKAKELYCEVQVIEEPTSLANFREFVHDKWLINRCGNLACHGGNDGGVFRLRSEPQFKASSRYANFLMLDRLVVDPQWPLINYEDPSRSLLIQYALPPNEAVKPHPALQRWTPAMSRERGKHYEQVIKWIKSMRQLPRPIYPVEFPLKRAENP
ncbi:MAG: hypothetical protein QF444_03045 [Phycisphaerales bacterium]|nr:hypothetical protein [Phycisphaerales bacterium]MDP6693278.1 hypothetical protein [Phycisphaerales bacterium]